MFLGVPISVVKRLGWTSAGFAAVQVLRFASNVILARLLSPPIFGIMAVVNAIRTGIELLSDVGITQNIVTNPDGDRADFYDTAWTIQVIRGITLAVVCVLLAWPLSKFFNSPELGRILPVASLFFLFTGFDSTSRGLTQKQGNMKRVSIIQVSSMFIAASSQVILACFSRTVWSLVLGAVFAGAATLVSSFFFISGIRHRFIIERKSVIQLMSFGRWIFFSSIIYFFAMNFDRLYFAKQISLSQLGVYGIARNLADVVTQFVQSCSNYVLYPMVAAAGLAPAELRRRILKGRRTLLFITAIALGSFVAVSGPIIQLLYDARYSEAGLILPILCLGVWFAVLTATNDAILLGLARPAYPALSNAAKLASYVAGVPLAFQYSGFMAAVLVISAGEVVKYSVLWIASHKEHLHFGRDDLVLTLVFGLTSAALWAVVSLVLSSTSLLPHLHGH